MERVCQAWGPALDYFTNRGDPRASQARERLRGLNA